MESAKTNKSSHAFNLINHCGSFDVMPILDLPPSPILSVPPFIKNSTLPSSLNTSPAKLPMEQERATFLDPGQNRDNIANAVEKGEHEWEGDISKIENDKSKEETPSDTKGAELKDTAMTPERSANNQRSDDSSSLVRTPSPSVLREQNTGPVSPPLMSRSVTDSLPIDADAVAKFFRRDQAEDTSEVSKEEALSEGMNENHSKQVFGPVATEWTEHFTEDGYTYISHNNHESRWGTLVENFPELASHVLHGDEDSEVLENLLVTPALSSRLQRERRREVVRRRREGSLSGGSRGNSPRHAMKQSLPEHDQRSSQLYQDYSPQQPYSGQQQTQPDYYYSEQQQHHQQSYYYSQEPYSGSANQ